MELKYKNKNIQQIVERYSRSQDLCNHANTLFEIDDKRMTYTVDLATKSCDCGLGVLMAFHVNMLC